MEDEALWPDHVLRMTKQMEDSLRALNHLWVEMGFTEDRMCNRMELVEMHCRDMFKTMVEEEEGYKDRLILDIKRYTEELKSMAFELKEDISLHEDWESLVIAENTLKAKLEKLKKIKEERFRIYWQLKATDKSVSYRLGVDEYRSMDGRIPSSEYLEDFKKHLATKESELDKAEKAFREKRENILSLMNELEIVPTTPLERNIASEDISNIRLTKEFLNSLQRQHQELTQQLNDRVDLAIQLRETLSLLWDRLCVSPAVRESFHEIHSGHGVATINALKKEINRCEELKRQNIKQFIEKLRAEIMDLWDKCLLGNEEEEAFPAFKSTDYTEDLLELHEVELARLKKEAESSKNVLEYLSRWHKLFWRQVDLDDRAEDPERLFVNRGGQLLKEEKERNAVQKELPKVEAILMKHYTEWCEAHGRKYQYKKDMELSEYIASRWKTYHEQKEMEKLERKRAKEMLLDQEAKLGTKASGGKRKYIGTPGKSPGMTASKLHRFEPSSTSKMKLTPSNNKSNVLRGKSPALSATKRCLLEPSINTRPKVPISESNKKTPSKVLHRLADPLDAEVENRLVAPICCLEENPNHSIASTVTYADFTHHLEVLSKDINCRSSAIPEPVTSERRPTPLRQFNAPKLVPILSPTEQIPGSLKKTPISNLRTPIGETARTPTRAISRTPATTSRTPQTTRTHNLRSASKSRLGTPKLNPRPFLV